MRDIAVLMAAGMGTRMRPITQKLPKPLVKVFGKPMIETIIEGLLKRPVEEIWVVTGYLAEQFDYLEDKYPGVRLLHNAEYSFKNNISSIYTARDILKSGNCFICESDLYVADTSIFLKELPSSCYYGRMQNGFSDDWTFTVENGRITRVGRGGSDTYNMVGVAYFRQQDAVILSKEIEKAYAVEKNGQLYWDEVVNANLDKLKLTIEPVEAGQIVEIDTVEELRAVDESAAVIE